jgi:hypothetical protein
VIELLNCLCEPFFGGIVLAHLMRGQQMVEQVVLKNELDSFVVQLSCLLSPSLQQAPQCSLRCLRRLANHLDFIGGVEFCQIE